MRGATEPLRREHRELRPHLGALRALADHIDDLPAHEIHRQLAEALAFLETELLPHAVAEDGALYPAVAAAMGAPAATATMTRDHLEIARLVEQLAYLAGRFHQEATKRLRRDVRRVLYALDAIVTLHLDKEEEIYLPLLDEFLTEEAATELFASLHHIARSTASPRRAS